MEIKSISNSVFSSQNADNNQKKQVKSTEGKQDKLEISEEANQMNKSSSDIKNITQIRERLRTNFYDSDEVIKYVSGEIYKEIYNK